MSDFADMLKAMANVPKQDINPENGSIRSLGGTLIKKRDVQKMVENQVPTGPSKPRGGAGPSGLDGVEDLLEDLNTDQTKIVKEIQDDEAGSVLPSQDAYLKMLGMERKETPVTESNSQPNIIKVEELTNENEVMQSYINMIDDDLY